jgi:hypothetical protein
MTVTESQLKALLKMKRWTPRSGFPPSHAMSDVVYALGSGLFLVTNPIVGEGDLVVEVAWAESNYWAGRAFDNPYRGDLTPTTPQWRPPPSLTFLGRPSHLPFAIVRDFERSRTGPSNVLLVTGHYRMTDGAFLYVSVNGSDRVTYMYASNQPRPGDEPVGIGFMLPEPKRRWFDRLARRSNEARRGSTSPREADSVSRASLVDKPSQARGEAVDQ